VQILNAALTSLVLGCISLTGCANIQPVGSPGNLLSSERPAPDVINWPEQYTPERATFFVTNTIDIEASPEVVWQVIIEAESWPTWYEGASEVVVPDSDDGVLRADSTFTWNTMGFRFTSVIHEYEPPTRLAWESRRRDIKGYHAWLIIPTETGCRLVTDESQFGLLANLQKTFQPNKLRLLHDVWLTAIKTRAESRMRGES
jgi:uncharacterized protein YndB with AHSA1/START domain